jgi:hypothetical protein
MNVGFFDEQVTGTVRCISFKLSVSNKEDLGAGHDELIELRNYNIFIDNEGYINIQKRGGESISIKPIAENSIKAK